MQKFFDYVTNLQGRAVSNAQVLVKTAAGATATIYSDNGVTPTANPVTTDDNGYFEFYAANGRYSLTISGAKIDTYTISDITLNDGGEPESISPEQYGAVGDGVADDTVAFQKWVAALHADLTIRCGRLPGIYLIDFAAVGLTNRLADITRNDLLITGGGTIKAKAGSYGAGVANGAYKNYCAFYVTGNRVTIENVTFDGNNQFSQYPSSPSLPHYWLLGVYFYGGSQGRVQNCRYINGGGWPFKGELHTDGVITGCYADHSQGIGFDAGARCVVSHNQSYNAHDAHFCAWNSTNAVISNNVADTNDNGSGIDVSGSKWVTVANNTIRNNYNRAIWVLQDPNTNNTTQLVTIVGNVCHKNRNYASITEGGEIHIAGLDPLSTSSPGRIDGQYVVIANNTIEPNNGNGITLGPYADDVLIEGNLIKAAQGTSPSRGIMVYNATNVTLRNNRDLIGNQKTIGAGPVFFESVDGNDHDFSAAAVALQPLRRRHARIIDDQGDSKSATAQRYSIHETWDGKEMSCRYTAGTTDKHLCEITSTAGGFFPVMIKVEAQAAGGRGMICQRFYYNIYSGGISLIKAAETEYTAGGAPTIVIADTSGGGTGRIRIAVTHDATLEGGATITVRGPGHAFSLNSLLT